jgi:O-antigen/teichoic acid export membrane protein
MSLKKRFFVAMATGVGGFGLKTVLNLVIIPFIIAYLGSSAYGVYVLLTTSVDMLSSIGFGLNRSFTLRLGQALGLQNTAEEKNLLRLSLWVYLGLIVALVLLGIASIPVLQSVMQWPDVFRPQVPLLVLLVLFESCLMIMGGYFRAMLAAHTRFGIANAVIWPRPSWPTWPVSACCGWVFRWSC